MRRILFLSLLLIFSLSACAPGGDAWECSNGVCVKIRSAGSIKKDELIPMVIKVKVDKDQPEMDVILFVDSGAIPEEIADKSDVIRKEKEGVGEIVWKKKMQAGKEMTITQNVRFQEPGDYTVKVMVFLPNDYVGDMVVLRITEEGGMKFLAGTSLPPATQLPLHTGTPGPTPTFLPTETSRPSPTPMDATSTPEPTATPPAYPQP